MLRNRSFCVYSILLVLVLILSGCNLAVPATSTPVPPSTQPVSSSGNTGAQVIFTNLTDGGTVAVTLDADGRPLVNIQVEVTGMTPLVVDLTANGLPVVDSGGHPVELTNSSGASPFTGEMPWSPANGGGDYTLVVTAMDNDKQYAEGTIHVTVTGIPAFTPTPPPLAFAAAQQRISQLIQQQFGVSIPKPSLQRFDFPLYPASSLWIAAAYYRGTRYYIDLFDDTHYAWSNADYTDPAHKVNNGQFVICRPVGTFKVLTIFVDYGNIGANRDEILAKVPVVVSWLNGLYTNFATSQGLSAPLMTVQADAAYVSPPPAPGDFLTADQIRTLTGKDPAAYDFLMQIDLDANGTLANRHFAGLLESGGGIALQGCGVGNVKYDTIINIWSSASVASDVEGELIMDFNHELSHLFGMEDTWPYIHSTAGPDGTTVADWIPYVMFGWTDTDGDGIPEILDPTPYGTTGP